jgi:predicted porin
VVGATGPVHGATLFLVLAASASPAFADPAAPGTGLTFLGVTVYGVLDVGAAYLTHGAPLSPYFNPGLPFIIQKFNDRPITSIAPNGLGQSKIGMAGAEPIGDGITAVFQLETGFQPTSGALTNGPKSLIAADGAPLNQQTTSGDSNRAGQVFQGPAYGGFASNTFGALTFGRQDSLLFHAINTYDPQAQSLAFSVIGYSGVAGGAGATEDARLDSALRYTYAHGPFRLAALHQFGGEGGNPGGANEVDLGGDYGGLSVDAIYSHLSDAISPASLTAAQTAAAPGTLAATISDNTSYSVQAKFVHNAAKIYAGFERIDFADPARPLPPGISDIGGYTISVVNNAAFKVHKTLDISWVGLRYSVTSKLDLTGAYYRYDQNSYEGNGCANTSAPSCSGGLNAVSMVAAYRLAKHFTVYGGVIYSNVMGGLASGYLNSATVGTMSGVRITF